MRNSEPASLRFLTASIDRATVTNPKPAHARVKRQRPSPIQSVQKLEPSTSIAPRIESAEIPKRIPESNTSQLTVFFARYSICDSDKRSYFCLDTTWRSIDSQLLGLFSYPAG